MWLRSALTRLRESRLSLSGQGSSNSSDLRSPQLPSSDISPSSVSEYPKELLHCALIAIDDLRIEVSPTLLESVVPSLVTLGLVSPSSPHAVYANPTSIESRPSDKNARELARERSLRPSSSATDGVQSSKALQAQQYLSSGAFDEFASAPAAAIPKQPAIPHIARDAQSRDPAASSALPSVAARPDPRVVVTAAHRTRDDEAKGKLNQILKSSEPREHVWSLLESFVFDELARALDACYSLPNANTNPEVRAFVLNAAPAPVSVSGNPKDASILGQNHPFISISGANDISHAAVNLIDAEQAEVAFRAAISVCMSATDALVSPRAKCDLQIICGRNSTSTRVYMSALGSLTRMLATAGHFHRIADLYHKISHSIDISAIQNRMDGTNSSAVAPLCRSLISSVILPNDLLAIMVSKFVPAVSLLLCKPNGGACMDAHLLVPRDAFHARNASFDSSVSATLQHEVRTPTAEKALLVLQYARIIFQQTKLASLHAYCFDLHSDQFSASAFGSSPTVHTELAKMDPALDQVERWLRNPSAFSARTSAAGSEASVGNRTICSDSAQIPALESPVGSVAPTCPANASSLLATSIPPVANHLDILSMVALKVCLFLKFEFVLVGTCVS